MKDIEAFISREEIVTWLGYIHFNKSRLKQYLVKLRTTEPSTRSISSKGYKADILQRIIDSDYSRDAILAAAEIETTEEALRELRDKLEKARGFRQLIMTAADPR